MSILRVFICGAHSTGKSTLLNDLREYLDLQFEQEIARQVMRRKGLSKEDISPEKHPDVFRDLQQAILERQCETDRTHVNNRTDYAVDRGIDPIVYTQLYLGEDAKERILETAAAKECIKRYQTSLVFVLTPHVQCMEDDGTRLTPKMEELTTFTEMMQRLMTSLDISYRLIDTVNQAERVRIVCSAVNERKPGIVR